MQSDTKYLLVLLGFNTLINLVFLYRYSNIEFGIETDTDIVIRKVIALEDKIDELVKKS